MSGQNSITIQVDDSGALMAIRETTDAVRELGDMIAQTLTALQGATSVNPFSQVLEGTRDAISTTSDYISAVNGLATLPASLAALAPPFLAVAEAEAGATVATGLLSTALTALPLVGIAAAVGVLATGLFTLLTQTKEGTRHYGSLKDALEALRPAIGGSGESLTAFTERLAKASATSRELAVASLEVAKATAESDRRQQAAAAGTALESLKRAAQDSVSTDPLTGNFVTASLPQVDPAVAKAFKDFASSANKDVGELGAALHRLGPAGMEALATLVNFQGKQVSLLELANASQLTNSSLTDLGDKLEIARQSLNKTEKAAQGNTGAVKDGNGAIKDQIASQEKLNKVRQQGDGTSCCDSEVLKKCTQAVDSHTASQEKLNKARQEGDGRIDLSTELAELMAQTDAAFNALNAASEASQAAFYDMLDKDLQKTLAATKAQADEAKKATQQQAEEANKAAQTIAKGWGEALLGQFTGKGDSIKNWFKGLFKQIATDALKNKIILPVSSAIAGVFGGMGIASLGGTAQAAGQAGATGIEGLFSQLSGGLTKALDGLQAGVTKLGSTLFGSAAVGDTAATSGLLGSGGQLFGSTNLATGLTGALGGVGLGVTAGGLLGALGIGKGNSQGAAIGGAIGGTVGSFVPVLGTTIGGLLGGAIGSLFGSKPSNKEGSAVIDLSAGNYQIGGFTGAKFSQANRDTAGALAKQVLAIKDSLEKSFGARISGNLAVGAGDRDGLFATSLNSTARTTFTKDEAGTKQLVAFVTGQFVAGIRDQLAPEIGAALGRIDFSDLTKAAGDLDFVRNFRDSLDALKGDLGFQDQAARQAADAVRAQTQAVKDFRETTARLFPDAVAEADAALKSYVEGLVGIRQAADPLTQVETAVAALQARFEAYKPLLEEVGYTAEQAQTAIAAGLQSAKDQLKGDYQKNLDRQYNDLTGKGYVNQINDLITNRNNGYRDAAALGVDPALVDRNFAAGVAAQVKGLDRTQLEELQTTFADVAPVLSVVNEALARLNGTLQQTAETAEEAAARAARTSDFRDGLLDRRARASGAADTEAGQLAIFDRAAAQERAATQKRIDEGELGAEALTELEATLSDERQAITRDFAQRQLDADKAQADKAAEFGRSLADRKAALDNANRPDGEIRLLERKQKAEYDAAVAAGYSARQLDLLSQVLQGEMAQAVDAVNERVRTLNAGIADRLFAATTDTSTRDGALAAFDRRTAQERADIAMMVGTDLVSFDRATAAERLRIEQDFAQRAAMVNQGYADRLFAASNDTETLTGALAAFERQAARDRLEAARTDGADLVLLEQAQGAERARIIKSFADKAIAEAQAKADAARDTLIQAYQREADAARTLAANWREAGQNIRNALKADQLSDRYSSLNPDQRAAQAEGELRDLARRANDPSLTAQERLAAAQALPDARRAYLDAVRPLYEGTERWGQALDLSAQLLQGVADAGDMQADLAQRQVDLAEDQLNALGVVNDSVLSVAEALDRYRQATEALATAKAAAPVPTPAAQSPAIPANSNQPAVNLADIQLKQGAAFGNKDGVLNPIIGPYQYALDRRDARGGGQVDFYASAEAAFAAAKELGLGADKVVRRYQKGGIVGNGQYDIDSVLARYQDGGYIALAGGEFVTRAPSVNADTTPILRAINDTGRPPATLRPDEGSKRVEALLTALLSQAQQDGRRQAELDARGYDLLADRLTGLLTQGQDAAADRRRVAR